MSSYLNIYLKDKKSKENKHLVSFSRNHPICQAFDETLNIIYADTDDKFTEVSSTDVSSVIDTLTEDREKFSKRLAETEKYAKDNSDLINEILSLKEYIDEQTSTINQIEFLLNIADDIEDGYSDFEALLMNIC